jgi:methionyl aminopeptidase
MDPIMFVDATTNAARPGNHVKLHGPEAFVGMRAAGRLAGACLDMLVAETKAGVTTERIDTLARDFVLDHGALPACVFYKGYRHTVCTSLNHVVCHGIPGPRVLRDGDILNIDVTVIVDGWHGDTSRMYAIGDVKKRDRRLMDVTYTSMMKGIETIRPGSTLGDLGHAIQKYAEDERLSVVRDFCGHGLGKVFHDPPNILHYGRAGEGMTLRPGMIFTVEPMVNAGGSAVKVLNDGWTAVTKDKQPSAQYEHAVGVTETGVEIFTTSPAGLHQPHQTPG